MFFNKRHYYNKLHKIENGIKDLKTEYQEALTHKRAYDQKVRVLNSESLYASVFYDRLKIVNKKNRKQILHRVIEDLTFENQEDLIHSATKRTHIDTTKNPTVSQVKYFISDAIYKMTDDLGGEMHVNGEGAVNFPKFDGIKGIDGITYLTRNNAFSHSLINNTNEARA